MDKAEEIISKAKKYLITSMVAKMQPIVIANAQGSIVKDIRGKEYIDCFSGISVVNTGHCNPEVVNAASAQAKKLIHACSYVYFVPATIRLAERLAQITPSRLQKTFFGNSGAEALECAIKLARKYTKKPELIALMGSFHGRTLGTLSITGQAQRRNFDMGPYLSGTTFACAPYCYRCFFEKQYPNCDLLCARSVEDIIEYTTSKGIAAFIAEPLMGEGGIVPPPPEYFTTVKEILDENEILFIADEVQTGFGRTGKLFAIEHYDVEPSIMTLAKGIANGFPISACTTTSEIGDSFEPGDHLSTFGGNPVCAAAAISNIDFIVRENLPHEAAEKGRYIMERLGEMKEEHDIIGDVRGKGLMIGIELVRNQAKKTPAPEETTRVRDLARDNGVLIGSGGVKGSVLRIQPPLTIERQQIDKSLEILEMAISSVRSEF